MRIKIELKPKKVKGGLAYVWYDKAGNLHLAKGYKR